MKKLYTKRDLQDAFDSGKKMESKGQPNGRSHYGYKYRNFSEYFEAKYPKPIDNDSRTTENN